MGFFQEAQNEPSQLVDGHLNDLVAEDRHDDIVGFGDNSPGSNDFINAATDAIPRDRRLMYFPTDDDG